MGRNVGVPQTDRGGGTSRELLRKPIGERRDALLSRFAEWTPRTLDGWLDACAATYADRPMVITDDVTYTYAEVADRSRRYADGLAALGVRPGDRVGMLMAHYAEFVPLKFAIARAGAVAIPFNYLYKREELGYVLAQSQCSVLITMSAFASLDYQAMLDKLAVGWDRPGFADRERPGRPDAPNDLRHVAVFPGVGVVRDGAATVEDLLALGDANCGLSGAPDHSPATSPTCSTPPAAPGLPRACWSRTTRFYAPASPLR